MADGAVLRDEHYVHGARLARDSNDALGRHAAINVACQSQSVGRPFAVVVAVRVPQRAVGRRVEYLHVFGAGAGAGDAAAVADVVALGLVRVVLDLRAASPSLLVVRALDLVGRDLVEDLCRLLAASHGAYACRQIRACDPLFRPLRAIRPALVDEVGFAVEVGLAEEEEVQARRPAAEGFDVDEVVHGSRAEPGLNGPAGAFAKRMRVGDVGCREDQSLWL